TFGVAALAVGLLRCVFGAAAAMVVAVRRARVAGLGSAFAAGFDDSAFGDAVRTLDLGFAVVAFLDLTAGLAEVALGFAFVFGVADAGADEDACSACIGTKGNSIAESAKI
ncbi:MAG: hypothetical protein R3186_06490, partial [Ruegeria sp.]|nr:hypothetical protein [Ruegeria sp.]